MHTSYSLSLKSLSFPLYPFLRESSFTFLRLYLLGLILFFPYTGLAKKINLHLTDTLTADQRTDNQNTRSNDDNYGVLLNRLNWNGSIYKIRVSGRLDTMYFHSPPNSDYQNDPIRLERFNLKYRKKRWNVQLGDFYQQLGRGQILALRKVDQLGLDIALRGGRFEYRSKEHSFLALSGISNVVNIDMVSQYFVEDQYDWITAGQYRYRGFKWGDIGLIYALNRPEEQTIEGLELPDATQSGGIYVNIPSLFDDHVSLYAEYDHQQRRLIEKVVEGQASYFSLDFHHKNTTLLTEGAWINDFQQRGSENTALRQRFDYNQTPTLERIDQEVAENYNFRGIRTRLQQALFDHSLTLHANLLYRITQPDDPMEIHQYHGYLGGEYLFDKGRSRLSLSGGHRFDEKEGYINRIWSHFEGDYVQHLFNRYAFHLTTQLQRIRVEQQPFFVRGSTVVGIEKSGLGGLSMEWGIDTQNPLARNQFFAGILNWHISRKWILNSIIGNQRGGIKCVGGVCRDFPAFSGYRLQVIFRQSI